MKKTTRQKQTPNTVLVSLMNNPADLLTLKEKGWYRIRKSKISPLIIRNRTAKYIAFYQTSRFKNNNPCSIQLYGDVGQIEEVTRQDLFPNELSNHKKAKNEYYKIEIKRLRPLPKPIYSNRPRRILFIPTSEEKFFGAMELQKPEINFLFNDSPLEDLLFQKLIDSKIYPERQFLLKKKAKRICWILPFFAKNKNSTSNVMASNIITRRLIKKFMTIIEIIILRAASGLFCVSIPMTCKTIWKM